MGYLRALESLVVISLGITLAEFESFQMRTGLSLAQSRPPNQIIKTVSGIFGRRRLGFWAFVAFAGLGAHVNSLICGLNEEKPSLLSYFFLILITYLTYNVVNTQ